MKIHRPMAYLFIPALFHQRRRCSGSVQRDGITLLGTVTNLSPIQKQVIDQFAAYLQTCPE